MKTVELREKRKKRREELEVVISFCLKPRGIYSQELVGGTWYGKGHF